MPKAERSTPTGSRPASRSGFSEAAIMSRRAATTITSICGAAPSVAPTPPTTRWSITAWSRGIAICSWAVKRTAASSSAGFSIAGRRRVRTTTRWLAIPSRTRLLSLLWAKSARSASATLSGSATSPSWKASGGSDAVATAFRCTAPLLRTSAAPMLPASISRPTREGSLPFPRLSEGSDRESTAGRRRRRRGCERGHLHGKEGQGPIASCIDETATEPLPWPT